VKRGFREEVNGNPWDAISLMKIPVKALITVKRNVNGLNDGRKVSSDRRFIFCTWPAIE